MTLDDVLASLGPVGGIRDGVEARQAFQGADLERLSRAVDWWVANRDHPPSVADLRWVARVVLDEAPARSHIAAARLALANPTPDGKPLGSSGDEAA